MNGGSEAAFRHDAVFYRGASDFLDQTMPFIRAAIALDEPVLVAVRPPKLGLLREALGAPSGVAFLDIGEVGGNPARILPLWTDFVDAHAGHSGLRGIGEPIWAGRDPEELVECERHEALLNLAFEKEVRPWWLICPYDVQVLPEPVIETSKANHPFLLDNGSRRPSPAYRPPGGEPLSAPLPEPPITAQTVSFGAADIAALRDFVGHQAIASGLDAERAEDLVLAVDEVATNSVRHGGGEGRLLIWGAQGHVLCEIRDEGLMGAAPLAGRLRPPPGSTAGFGLWIANQVCDLVQIRSTPRGSVVRLRMRSKPA